jgi:four helix bundle protein
MKDFRKLTVWEKSHRLTLEIYKATVSFLKEELYGITSQLRRSATSIPTNIAEGCGRGSDSDFKRFLQIAFGSASETEYLLLLATDLNYLEADKTGSLKGGIEEIKKILSSLISTIKNKN